MSKDGGNSRAPRAGTVFGVLLRDVEGRGPRVPRAVGGLLLAFGLVGGVLTPVSGFWFFLYPAWRILRSRHVD